MPTETPFPMIRSSPTQNPPKPNLVFRVGVVGHRPNRLNRDKIPDLEEKIRELLVIIREATLCARRHAGVFCGGATATAVMRIVSPLAEGTDRLAARVALDAGFELQCPMPFPERSSRMILGRPRPWSRTPSTNSRAC
jgi:hypothetical protein